MSTPMRPKSEPLSPAKIQANLQQLTTAAQTLNELSDQLTKQIAEIETILNRLNLGVTAKVDIESWSNEDGMYSHGWRLAYGKQLGKWGFLIEQWAENLNHPEWDGGDESWPFKDSPREQRIKAVEKIPLLLEALVKKSNQVALDITDKVSYAKNLVSTFSKPSPDGSGK